MGVGAINARLDDYLEFIGISALRARSLATFNPHGYWKVIQIA
ncbi:MAG: hypothetical protein RL508_326 [Actinomycetota bacterium]|jgi:hypothetical protein